MSPRTAPNQDLAALASRCAQQDHVVTRRQLRELGVTPYAVRRQVAAREWQLYGSKVVVTSPVPITRAQRRRAAVLHAGPRALLGGFTALECHGLEGWDRDEVHLVVPAGTHVTEVPGVVAHRTHRLDVLDRSEFDGVPVTTAARAVLDAARWLRSSRSAAGLVLATMQQGLATSDDIGRSLAAFVTVHQKDAIVMALSEGDAGAESLSESVAAELLVLAGFPEPVRQMEIDTSMGRRRIDLAVPLGDGRLLVVEIDGPRHDDESVRLVDAVKDATLLAAGHIVVRIPASDVLHRREMVLSQLRALRRALLAGTTSWTWLES